MVVQMADKANLCSESSVSQRTKDDRNIRYRVSGSGFPCLPPLHCCGCPVGLANHGAFATGGAPFGPVFSGFLPGLTCVTLPAHVFS